MFLNDLSKKIKRWFFLQLYPLKLYAENNPRGVVIGMFLLLTAGTIYSLVARHNIRKEKAGVELKQLFDHYPKPRVYEGSTATELMDLLDMQNKLQKIDPNNMNLRDTSLLKEIDESLNQMIDERTKP
jgi:hypothetical protein